MCIVYTITCPAHILSVGGWTVRWARVLDPDVKSTGTPYAYANDDGLNATDPIGLSWCLSYGLQGPCPSGYTPGPPYDMRFSLHPGAKVKMIEPRHHIVGPVIPNYVATMRDGLKIQVSANGTGLEIIRPVQRGSAAKWERILNSSAAAKAGTGISCTSGAGQAVTDEGQQAGWWAGVWFASQFVPVVDIGVDAVTVIATVSNAAYGCLSS